MLKPNTPEGGKNLINQRLRELREQRGMSQNGLAQILQLKGYDIDKNTITRIEKNSRYVTDIELKAFVEVFGVGYGYLIEGKLDNESTKEELQ